MDCSRSTLVVRGPRSRIVSSAYSVKKYLWIPEGGHGPSYPSFPALVIPRGNDMGSPPENSVVLVGIFHIIQCVNGPLGASTSTTVSARLFAFCGTPDIARGGDV